MAPGGGSFLFPDLTFEQFAFGNKIAPDSAGPPSVLLLYIRRLPPISTKFGWRDRLMILGKSIPFGSGGPKTAALARAQYHTT